MNRPNIGTMIMGHPIVSTPLLLGTLAVCYGWTQNGGLRPIALPMLFATYRTADAVLARSRYLDWKRAWDGMAEPSRKPSATTNRSWRPWAGCAMLALLGAFFAANSDQTIYAFALLWLIGAVIVASIIAMIRWRAPRKAATAKSETVTVCINGPLLPVPSLRNAYRAMPAHCLKVLGTPARS